jgi:O-antigen/teichoic acid export membrane protein
MQTTEATELNQNILATAKGGGFLAGGIFFEFATRFVIAVLLARVLGAEGYGLYVLSISAATLFAGISLLGLDDAMVRYVAILSGRRDDIGVWGTLQIGFGISALTGLVMGGVLHLGASPLATGLFDEPRLTPLLHVFAVIVPFLTMSNMLLGVARGFRRMDYAALAENVVQTVVRMALLGLLALLAKLNLYVAAVIFGIADVASSITLIVLLNRHFPLNGSFRLGVRRDVREIFGFAFPLWLSGLLRKFRRNIEVVMLGALSSVSSVAVFAVINKVNLVGHVSMLSLLVAVKPTLAQLHDRQDREGLGHLYQTASRWTLSLNLPFFLITVLYSAPLLFVFGETFSSATNALIILAFAELVNAGTGICGAMIDMTGHTKVKLVNSALWTALLIGSAAALIPRWGVVGAAVATLIAMTTVNILCVAEVWVLERLIPFNRSFWKPLGAGLGAFTAGLALRTWLPVGTDLAPAVLQGTVVLTLYASLILLFGPAPEDRLVIARAIKKSGLLVGRGRAVLATAARRSV